MPNVLQEKEDQKRESDVPEEVFSLAGVESFLSDAL